MEPFRYNPKAAERTFPKGVYPAQIKSLQMKTAKSSGNTMAVFTWTMHHPDGRTVSVIDNVVFPSALWRLEQIARIVGADFQSGELRENEYVGKWADLSVDRETSQTYGEKNNIIEYRPLSKRPEPPRSDDIPF